MSKSSENVIKSAEAKTDDKALSAAAEVTGPAKDHKPADLNGDGKVTLTERVTALEKIVEDLGKQIIELQNQKAHKSHPGSGDVEGRVADIERRLEGVVSK
jgi:hypothetical protein